MSRASDIAMARSARTGKMNFAWSKADVVFDDTREHEVMTRLVEHRGAWWADTNGSHGSRNYQLKQRNASTKSDAEASAREALAGMAKGNDITLELVVITLPPAGVGQFQQAVFYSVRGRDKRKVGV